MTIAKEELYRLAILGFNLIRSDDDSDRTRGKYLLLFVFGNEHVTSYLKTLEVLVKAECDLLNSIND